jgi:divalent metal cation (Fe/Co/Zn/Cd) transporter
VIASHAPVTARAPTLRRALRLEYLTVGWNVVEGVIGVGAGLAAGSVALIGFGLDSFVETASGGILVWRLVAERRMTDLASIERLDRRAHKLVGASLFLLALYVAGAGGWSLWSGERPEASVVGLVLTTVSLLVMRWLAGTKRQAAAALGSRAMQADAFQTTACWWLSLSALVGVGLNAAWGFWWADPAAAIAMTYFMVREGREAWRGEPCGCDQAAGGR